MESNLPLQTKKYRKSKDNPAVKQYIINTQNKWEEVDFPVAVPQEKPAYQDALDYYLKGNPFLHNMDSEYKINTIEEYYVKNSDEYILINDLVRSGQYSKRKQRRILKRNFDEWIKSYNKEKHETIKVAESTFTMIGKLKFSRFGFFKQMLLILMFIVMMSFVYPQNSFVIRLFRPVLGTKILTSLQLFFETYRWSWIVVNVTLYGIIAAVLVIKFIDTVQNDYRVKYNRTQRMLNNSKRILHRDFKKKSSRTRKYYLNKVINRPNKYPPLRIENIGESKMTIQRFNNVSKNVIVSGASIKRWNWLFSFLRVTLLGISYLGGLGLLVLIIYQIIKGIFN